MTDGEIVPASLGRPAAEKLDARLRRMAATTRHNMETLSELVVQAKEAGIAQTLGFPSWTAYLADALGGTLQIGGVADRREMVQFLAGEGMSERAIASAAGVAKTTVHRDLESEVVLNGPPAEPRELTVMREQVGSRTLRDALPPDQRAALDQRVAPVDPVDLDRKSNVTGVDGKTYKPKPSRPKPPKSDVIRRKPIGEDAHRLGGSIDQHVGKLYDLADKLAKLHKDDRYQKNRADIDETVGRALTRLADCVEHLKQQ